MKSVDYLDQVKAKLGIQSDYALAKALKVAQPTVINYRRGLAIMDVHTAAKIARILDINPMKLIALTNLERAEKTENEELRVLWKEILDRAKGGFNLLLSPAPEKAVL